jgi:protein-tyrosine phosphatase
MYKVCFVCLGNICRSPMAEGVFGRIAGEMGLGDVVLDSAGTSDWHIGAPPDDRAVAAAAARGIDISHLRARQFAVGDFADFDLIAAMDSANLSKLRSVSPPDSRTKVRLFLDFSRDFPTREVPDPYYGGEEGFEQVLDLLEIASRLRLAMAAMTGPRNVAR